PTYEIARTHIFIDPITKEPLATLQTLNNWYKEIENSIPSELKMEEIKEKQIQEEQQSPKDHMFPPSISSKKPYGFK
nr:hypothetical protein [Nanoarchaeota archaeon]